MDGLTTEGSDGKREGSDLGWRGEGEELRKRADLVSSFFSYGADLFDMIQF